VSKGKYREKSDVFLQGTANFGERFGSPLSGFWKQLDAQLLLVM